MKIALEIPDKRITELLHESHAGHASPWLHKLSGKWSRKDGFLAHYDLEEGEEGDNKGRGRFRCADVEKGLTLMAMKSPYQWQLFMEENDDDVTFDTALQYIIFGKLVYA